MSNGHELALSSAGQIDSKPTSTTDRLHSERARLEERLEAVNQAIMALESNPEIQAAIDSISKLGHF